jgi:hypothetical protein
MSYTVNTPESKRIEEKLIVMDIFGSNEGGGAVLFPLFRLSKYPLYL